MLRFDAKLSALQVPDPESHYAVRKMSQKLKGIRDMKRPIDNDYRVRFLLRAGHKRDRLSKVNSIEGLLRGVL